MNTYSNAIINGMFDVWQWYTSSDLEGWVTADNWINTLAGTSTQTLSREAFVVGQMEVPGNPQYFQRAEAVGMGALDDLTRFGNYIESVRTYAGQRVTVSFWARRSSGAGNIRVYLNQFFGSGGSPTVQNGPYTAVLTTDWAPFSIIIQLESILGKTIGTDGLDALQLLFYTSQGSGAFQQTIGVDIANVQVTQSDGTQPPINLTPPETLMICQRLTTKSFALDTVPVSGVGLNTGEYSFPATDNGTATQRSPSVQFPTRMRGVPTILFYNPVTFPSSTVRDVTASADCGNATAINVSQNGFIINVSGNAATVVGNDLRVHWLAYAVR